ncbi:MAG: class I SAM-dependent methyltransferase [Deltaproteobacteria bacterium]|nr:class I SAM-dependent methyltransferase [Deltaproteobacteria bacterium]
MFARGGPTFLELMRQALSSTDKGYDLLAPKFELTPFRTPDAVLNAAVPVLGNDRSIARAVDLCCGTGAGLKLLRPLCRDEVVGIDRSQGMLAEARTRLSGPGAPLVLVRGDVLDSPFRDAFDLATCFGAFGHILEEDEPRFVKSVHALLKPGGRFAFYTAHKPKLTNPGLWLAKGFNAAMRVRNALIHPPFIMYYLTFLLDRATTLLEAAGFDVSVHENLPPPPFNRLVLVVATKR